MYAVDSSAAVIVPGKSPCVSVLSCCRKVIASRFSRPPNRFGNPLALAARIVQIQHRRDRVDAQPVDVVFLEPEQRVRQQEVPHLVAAVVEDQRAPVLMLALPRVRVLVERGAVKLREAVLVFREMPGHPVENEAEPGLVAGVDEVLEVLRRPEAARRREEPEHLVAPGARKRMLHHRQQLDVREAGLLRVRHQPARHLAIREEAVAFLRHARPRPEVDFVDRHRPIDPGAALPPRGHPRIVIPRVARDVFDDRRGERRHFERDAERIALLQQRARAACESRTCISRRRADPG